ncbi:MAG: tetratricopeptide repeat protein [Rhodospirillales bacterium]|nr:tetratricopeptide repeat protein [Rhodospirillales bacterium]
MIPPSGCPPWQPDQPGQRRRPQTKPRCYTTPRDTILEIHERVLGPEHPSTATIFNNVASCLNAQGRHGEAEALYRKALEIRERVLGPDHPQWRAIRRRAPNSHDG